MKDLIAVVIGQFEIEPLPGRERTALSGSSGKSNNRRYCDHADLHPENVGILGKTRAEQSTVPAAIPKSSFRATNGASK